MTETEDNSEDESPFFTDPTQIFGQDPNYNHAVHKAGYLQVPAEAALQIAIQEGKFFPSTKKALVLLANVMLDSSNTLSVRNKDELLDLELTNEMMQIVSSGSYFPNDNREGALYDIINSIKYLNRNIVTRSLGGFERKLQNQSEQVITQRNFMSTDDPSRITEPEKKKSFWRRS